MYCNTFHKILCYEDIGIKNSTNFISFTMYQLQQNDDFLCYYFYDPHQNIFMTKYALVKIPISQCHVLVAGDRGKRALVGPVWPWDWGDGLHDLGSREPWVGSCHQWEGLFMAHVSWDLIHSSLWGPQCCWLDTWGLLSLRKQISSFLLRLLLSSVPSIERFFD